MQRFNEHFDISHPNPSVNEYTRQTGWQNPHQSPYEHHRSVSLGSRSMGSHPEERGSPKVSPAVDTKDPYDYYGSMSPSVPAESMSPGLESVRDDSDKEVAFFPPPTPQITRMDSIPEHMSHVSPEERQRRRRRGMKRVCFAALVLALIIALAIGLGVGLGLKKKHKGSSNMISSGGTYYSTDGAFNGTGLALASQSFGEQTYGDINLYFQHHTGEIRVSRLNDDGSWQGGSIAEVVASGARNGTPIAAVSYARDDVAAWHIFYIDDKNLVRERINTNITNIWADGPLNEMNLVAMEDLHTGLQACWYGSFYGDANYTHSPVPGAINTNNTADTSDQDIGIHLWYGTNSTTLNEVSWVYKDPIWTQQQVFTDVNAHGGVGCYSWATGSISYAFMLTMQNEIEILWKDLNTTSSGNESHPVNEWTKTSVVIPGVFENTSLGYTNYLYAQMADLSVNGFNISWDAENTTLLTEDTFTINGDPGLPGTHLTVTTLPTSSGGNSLLCFYQVKGDDVTEFVRDLDAGQWTMSSIDIPNT